MARWISWRLRVWLCCRTERDSKTNTGRRGNGTAAALTSMWVCLLVLASACVWGGRPASAQAADSGAETNDATYIVFDVASKVNTIPTAMSEVGAITGQFYNQNPGVHGFLRTSRGTITTFDAPGSNLTSPIRSTPRALSLDIITMQMV
jgi:hypothetical protein